MHIAVVDDEKAIREQVKRMIAKQTRTCRVEAFARGEELLNAETEFDLIFLDIGLEGMNGVQTARALRERNGEAVLVFLTGSRDYVFDAFEVSAFYYLLKPVAESAFERVFQRAQQEVEKKKACAQKQFFIRTRNRNVTLDCGKILYVESRGRKAEFHTAEETIEIYAAMKELEEKLGEGFFRCHRGYLVNMAHIAEYDSETVRLNNGEHIYLAKGRYHAFVKKYMRYLRNGGAVCV